jgi:hypothetical protein
MYRFQSKEAVIQQGGVQRIDPLGAPVSFFLFMDRRTRFFRRGIRFFLPSCAGHKVQIRNHHTSAKQPGYIFYL